MNKSREQLGQKLTEKDYNAILVALNETSLVSMTDARGDILYANETFVRVSKYSLDELLGQNHRILKSGHQPDEMFVALWKTISSGGVWRGEIKNRAKDGSYYWVDTSIAPIPGEDGKPERYISVRVLITEKKKTEEDLSEQKNDLEKMNKFMVGRENKMTELKGEIKRLREELEELKKNHNAA